MREGMRRYAKVGEVELRRWWKQWKQMESLSNNEAERDGTVGTSPGGGDAAWWGRRAELLENGEEP